METEAQYWKKVALWLADVQAATAYDALCRRSTPKREQGRQRSICNHAQSMLMGSWPPGVRDSADMGRVMDRLKTTAETQPDPKREKN